MSRTSGEDVPRDLAQSLDLRRELADQVRELVLGLVETAPPDDALAALISKTEALNREVATLARSADGEGSLGQRWRYYSPFRGELNPVAPPVIITVLSPNADDAARGVEVPEGTGVIVEGRVRVAGGREGPPGAVHGGVLAGLFDEVLGAACAANGTGSGVTARLEVRYRKPTPLNRNLLFRAWVSEDRGWRRTATARCIVDGATAAQATGLFVSRPASGS